MSKKTVKRNLSVKRDMLTSWDDAIADAERMMVEGKARLRRLRGSILVFQDRKDSGEPFPGAEPKKRRSKRASRNVGTLRQVGTGGG
jgi:hypothetical protein